MQYRSVIIRDTSHHQAALSHGILNRESFIYVDNMAQKIEAHRLGLGIGFVPLFRVGKYLQRGELIRLEVDHPNEFAPSQIAWKISNRGQARNWLVEQLKTVSIDEQKPA